MNYISLVLVSINGARFLDKIWSKLCSDSVLYDIIAVEFGLRDGHTSHFNEQRHVTSHLSILRIDRTHLTLERTLIQKLCHCIFFILHFLVLLL